MTWKLNSFCTALLFLDLTPRLQAQEAAQAAQDTDTSLRSSFQAGLGGLTRMNSHSIELTRGFLPKLSLGIELGRYRFYNHGIKSLSVAPTDDKFLLESYYAGIPITFAPRGNQQNGLVVFGSLLFGKFNASITDYQWDTKENKDEEPTLKCTRKDKLSGYQGTISGGTGFQLFPTRNIRINGGVFTAYVTKLGYRYDSQETDCAVGDGRGYDGLAFAHTMGLTGSVGYVFR